jgi:membrane associated rhomboid family serine protease
MSNIHRISDLENGNNGQGRGAGNSRMPLLGGRIIQGGNPRSEKFPSFLKNFCCPYFTYKSFIFFITIVDLIMFIITISFGIQESNEYLLPPKGEVLSDCGMLVPKKLRQGQVWRWLTYAFLHADFVHLLSNTITRLIIGTFVERIIGTWRVIMLYLATA